VAIRHGVARGYRVVVGYRDSEEIKRRCMLSIDKELGILSCRDLL
jgi:hypothetical protein